MSHPTFRKGGEDKVKACLHLFLHRNDLILNSFSGKVKGEGKKQKIADVRVHVRAWENGVDYRMKHGLFALILLMFWEKPVDFCENFVGAGIGDVEVWFYLYPLKKMS